MSVTGRRTYYCNEAYVVPIGAVDQELDIHQALLDDGRSNTEDAAWYLKLDTDITVTFKINSAAFDAITLTNAGLVFEPGGIEVFKLFFSHVGASSGSGDATLSIYAS